MSPRGRTPDQNATGHRARPGQGKALELPPVEGRLVSAGPPANMCSPVAAELWTVLVSDMAALGHLREPELVLLRGYCEQFAIMVEASADIAENGAMEKEPITAMNPATGDMELVGYKRRPNPAVKVHGDSLNRMRLLSNELLLNPLARIRGNLLEVATSSIAASVLEDLEKKLDAADAEAAAKEAKAAVAAKSRAARQKAPAKKPVATKKTTGQRGAK